MVWFTRTDGVRTGDSICQQQEAASVAITASLFDTELNAIATALNKCITKDADVTFAANQPMGGFKLTGLGAGASGTDSIQYQQAMLRSGGFEVTASYNFANNIPLEWDDTGGTTQDTLWVGTDDDVYIRAKTAKEAHLRVDATDILTAGASGVNVTGTLTSSGGIFGNSLTTTFGATIGGEVNIPNNTWYQVKDSGGTAQDVLTVTPIDNTELRAKSAKSIFNTIAGVVVTQTNSTGFGVTGTLSSSGAATLSSLAVTNASTLSGAVTLGSTITLPNDTFLQCNDSGAIARGVVKVDASNQTILTSVAGGNLFIQHQGTNKLELQTSAFIVDTTLTANGAATVGTTLGVTGATTLSSTLAAGNTTITGTLSTSSTATLDSLGVTNNATVGGTLGITGLTTAAAITASGALSANGGLTSTSGTDLDIDTQATGDSLILSSNGTVRLELNDSYPSGLYLKNATITSSAPIYTSPTTNYWQLEFSDDNGATQLAGYISVIVANGGF